ncbi:MAG: ATP phosphoribosyltransferase regulatory subunit [Acidobacteriota bacterium]
MIAAGGLSAGLWMEPTKRLREVEGALMELWRSRGFSEVVPPLLVPEAAARRASPEALNSRILPVRSEGAGPLALRADFTSGVAWMVSRRVERLDGPLRLCYSGVVVRRPRGDGSAGLEILQSGCERVSGSPGPEGDEEILALAAESLLSFDLKGAVLELGHWGLVGPLLESVAWPAEGKEALGRALNAKSLSALGGLEDRYGATAESRALRRLLHVGDRPGEVESLRPDLQALGAWEIWLELRNQGARLEALFPGLTLRLDPADVRHWDYYTGLTFKAFRPGHPSAVLSGGRYDGLYPALGRSFGAIGFAVDLSGIGPAGQARGGAVR